MRAKELDPAAVGGYSSSNKIFQLLSPACGAFIISLVIIRYKCLFTKETRYKIQ